MVEDNVNATCVPPSPAGPPDSCPLRLLYLSNLGFVIGIPNRRCIFDLRANRQCFVCSFLSLPGRQGQTAPKKTNGLSCLTYVDPNRSCLLYLADGTCSNFCTSSQLVFACIPWDYEINKYTVIRKTHMFNFAVVLNCRKQLGIFNCIFRYRDDLLNIDTFLFEHMSHTIYPVELQLNKIISSAIEAPFLDLNLSILMTSIISIKSYDK